MYIPNTLLIHGNLHGAANRIILIPDTQPFSGAKDTRRGGSRAWLLLHLLPNDVFPILLIRVNQLYIKLYTIRAYKLLGKSLL